LYLPPPETPWYLPVPLSLVQGPSKLVAGFWSGPSVVATLP
jgi:hypothetical protein